MALSSCVPFPQCNTANFTKFLLSYSTNSSLTQINFKVLSSSQLPVPRTGGSKSRGAVGPSTDPSVHYQPSVSRLRAPADLPRSCDVEQHVPSLAAPATGAILALIVTSGSFFVETNSFNLQTS